MKRSSSRLGAVALALLVTIATLAFALPVSAQDSTVTEIDSCTTITKPGTYVLTQDITDSDAETCIRIEAETDGVTIDGDGHTIDGIGAEKTDGIFAGENPFDADATRDITVENVVLTDWGNAIAYENVENSTIRDNTIESNGRGIDLFFGTVDVEVRNNVLTGNDVGIDALGGTVTIVDNVASNEVDYRSFATEDERVVNHTIENFTLDTATVSLENHVDQIDFFGGGGRFGLSAVESLPDDPDGLTNVGQYVEGDSNSNAGGSFALSVHYDDEDVPDDVDEDSLRLYQFTDGEWTEVPGSLVDTDANTVSDEFDDPTVFADGTVLAPLGQADGDDDADDGADDGDMDAGDGGADGGDESNDLVDIGSKDITIDLGDVTIADFDLHGPSLQDEHIDERTYSVGGFDIAIDGISVTIGDTDYRVGCVSIAVEPFDVILENVTLGDGE